MCRSAPGECYLLSAIQSLTRVHPTHQPSAKPHSVKNLHLPNRQKNFPHVPAILKKRNKFPLSKWRGYGGSSGWVREVWRVGRPLRKGSPCTSKVFLPLPHQTIRKCQRVAANGRVGREFLVAVGQAENQNHTGTRGSAQKNHACRRTDTAVAHSRFPR